MDNSQVGADWEPGPVVAWTESDGPGRLPPVAPRRLGIAGAIAAGIAASAMMTADTVCPEHSLFIEIAGLLAIVLTIVGVVAALRSSVLAPPLILAASVIGFSIGFVDVLHDPALSRIIAVAFGVGAIVATFSAASSVRMVRWERTVVADAERPLDPELFRHPSAPAAAPTALPQPQPSLR